MDVVERLLKVFDEFGYILESEVGFLQTYGQVDYVGSFRVEFRNELFTDVGQQSRIVKGG